MGNEISLETKILAYSDTPTIGTTSILYAATYMPQLI